MKSKRIAFIVVPAFLAIGLVTVSPTLAQVEPPDTSGLRIDGEYGYGFPPDISVDGHKIDTLINVVHWFMAALFVGWGVFFIYCLVRYRQRAGHKATHEDVKAKPAKVIELAVVAFEGVLLLGFSIPIWASVKNELPRPTDNPLRIRVVAEQFAWNFHYPGADGLFGRTGPRFIDAATNPVGIDPDDPNGEDDVFSGALNLPVDRPIICEISSKDVIHSFSVPVLRVKQDAIPGMRIPVWFQAKQTGTYQVACAQLCGNNHYKMSAPMVVRTPAAFEAWLEEKSAPPEEFDEDELED